MTIPSYFSNSYAEAREKLLSACNAKSLPVENVLNPNAKGGEGEDLFTDVVRLGPENASKVLVLCSGTHGAEGYCGSGVQVGLLNEGYFANLPTDLSVIMMHAMNPYGFSHNRRVNEHNIDLNRNFIDFSEPERPDHGYGDIHDFILPDEWEGAGKDAADAVIAAFIQDKGITAFQAAVSGGQYSHKDGLFYGGDAPTWSREMVRSVVPKYAGSADIVGVIDFHTGLGPYGYGELIGESLPELKALALKWYGDEVTDPEAGTSTSAPLTGTLGHGFAEAMPDKTLSFVTLEYGTYDINQVLDALRADNWLYEKGDVSSALGQTIKQNIKDTFYPDKDDWKEAVWTRATQVIDMALEGMARER